MAVFGKNCCRLEKNFAQVRGWGTPRIIGWSMWPKTINLFMTKICNFPWPNIWYPTYDWRVVQYTQLELIRLWYLRFNKLEIDSWTYSIKSTQIVSPSVDSTYQKSICTRLRKYSWSGLEGGLKMLSIQVDLIESTRIVQIDWSLWPHFENEEGSCMVISRILTSGGLCRVGWKCCQCESIWSNRHKSFPLLSIHP